MFELSRVRRGGRARVILLAIVVLVLAVGGGILGFYILEKNTGTPGTPPASEVSEEAPRVLGIGFVAAGSKSDWSFTFQHFRGHLGLRAQLRGQVDSAFFTGVSDSQQAERILQDMCAQGKSLICVTEYDHRAATQRMAALHPEVTFVQFLGAKQRDNLGTFAVRDWESAYVCGVVASLSSGGNERLGFVAAYPTGPGTWIPNAFLHGARSVNPAATLAVEYIESWHDPDQEIEAVKRLSERGVGVIYFLTISPIAGVHAAEVADMGVMTHFADLASYAPRQWLTGGVWELTNYYTEVAREVLAGTWTARHDELGFKEGGLTMARYGDSVPIAVIEKARATRSSIVSGELEIFSGPLYDQEGNLTVAEGTTLKPDEIRMMDWLMKGVQTARVNQTPSMDK